MVSPELAGIMAAVMELMNSRLGSFSVSTRWVSSVAFMLVTFKNAEIRGVPSFSDPAQRSKEYNTSSMVTALPLWNFTPSRRVKVY